MISFSAQAPLRAGPHGGSAERFRDGRCQRAPRPAYLRDSVLEGQLLPLHTFVEGEDESDVVSIRLPRRGRGGTKRRLSDTPTLCSPAGSQLTQLPNRSRLPRLPIQQQEQQKRNANCPTPTLRPKPLTSQCARASSHFTARTPSLPSLSSQSNPTSWIPSLSPFYTRGSQGVTRSDLRKVS